MSNHPKAADVAMAGHNGDVSLVVRGFSSPEGRVRATALGSFHRLEELDWERLRVGFHDADPLVRRRAAELSYRSSAASGSTTPANLLALHDGLIALLDDEATVAEVAAFALGELNPETFDRDRSAGPLERVVTTHDDALVRESAVAALGSLGTGLDTILGAMEDKATVRRRAVIALSPFEDPRVDEALAIALEDRDWQVRQAAEDLVAIAADGEPGEEPASDERDQADERS